jgi:hypothetical protein
MREDQNNEGGWSDDAKKNRTVEVIPY